MKSLNKYLNEGFFSNTGSGLNAAIDQWMKENTNCDNYTINNDGTIDVKDRIEITNKNITEFPDYIRFRRVGGYFDCSGCDFLKSLEGAPKEVGSDFICFNCGSLKSLEGAPKEVRGSFDCSCCKTLKSLEWTPEKVGRDFDCSFCISLTSLEVCPKKIGKNFYCSFCDSLTSLEGAPKEVGGHFNCSNCKKQFTEEDIKKVSNVKKRIMIH